MNKIAPADRETARRPSSRSATSEPGPCEGRQASPSNPNQPATTAGAAAKPEAVFFYCSAAEKALIRQSAKDRDLSMSAFLRQLATGTEPKRRRKLPCVDPALVLAVSRYGGNLNQIARWLNRAMLAGRVDLDAFSVARRLLTIERQLAQIIEAARRC
ncbi:plasmid mobilization protein [Roseobacter sp.]|uniref:plasmid mobilization protein n=1 Tax=Roseobacter sp. TaxID=1907202 RepID=UPI00385FB1EB